MVADWSPCYVCKGPACLHCPEIGQALPGDHGDGQQESHPHCGLLSEPFCIYLLFAFAIHDLETCQLVTAWMVIHLMYDLGKAVYLASLKVEDGARFLFLLPPLLEFWQNKIKQWSASQETILSHVTCYCPCYPCRCHSTVPTKNDTLHSHICSYNQRIKYFLQVNNPDQNAHHISSICW